MPFPQDKILQFKFKGEERSYETGPGTNFSSRNYRGTPEERMVCYCSSNATSERYHPSELGRTPLITYFIELRFEELYLQLTIFSLVCNVD